jgi:thiosulfate/3-mercaptopyruvate sulfurtransferase
MATTTDSYPRTDLLADPAWVETHRYDPNVRIIDCSGTDAYKRSHIDGAVELGAHLYVKDESLIDVMPRRDFELLMSRLGVGPDTLVVAYDDRDCLWATRLWWTLTYYGHTRAKVLDGGWQGWLADGRAISTGAAEAIPTRFVARTNARHICDTDELLARYNEDSVRVLDARSSGEWTGTDLRGNPRGGHIPGAIHIEWTRAMRDGRFLPPTELAALIADAGLSAEHEVVTHCQAGIRAAHGAFMLALLGFANVRVYEGSMKLWAAEERAPLAA